MDLTPTKSSITRTEHLMQTPESTNSERLTYGNNEDCHVLMETFSGMKICNAAGTLKRSADLMTVEGTPVNLTKRIDMNPTPNTKLLPSGCSTPYSTAIKLETHHCDDEEDLVDATNTLSRKGSVPYPRRVLVISSGTDDHNTGDHQENALRTALLCGTNGCLRRAQLGKIASNIRGKTGHDLIEDRDVVDSDYSHQRVAYLERFVCSVPLFFYY